MGLKNIESHGITAYAHVASHDQKEDLGWQAKMLAAYCTVHGWKHEVVQDLVSVINYRKKGLKRLLEYIVE